MSSPSSPLVTRSKRQPAANWFPTLGGLNLPQQLTDGVQQGFQLIYAARDKVNQNADAIAALVSYGTWQDRLNTAPTALPNGALWFHTDFLNAVYQVRMDSKMNQLAWFYATGVIWVPPGLTFNVQLGPNDIGLEILMNGVILVWDGVGPQLSASGSGSGTAGGGTSGSTGGRATQGGSGGGGTGTGGSGPPSTNPIPPGASVAGTVGNFAVSNTSVDLTSRTVTGTFSWTLPTVNPSQYAGLQLWIIGGTTVQEIGTAGPTDTSATVTIPFPALGVAPLVIAAITIDSVIGITMDPSTQAGQNSPTLIWNTGTGGQDPGSLADFVLDHQTTNSDGSVTGVFTWVLVNPSIFFGGVQLWRVATTGSEPVPQMVAASSAPATAQQLASVTAPASAVGETWTMAAVTVNNLGTPSPLALAQTRDWTIGG